MFSRLAAPGRLPAVIHCLAGKDRTGLTVALLLTALGVPRQVVLDDYQLTNDYRGVAHTPEVIALFVQAGLARPAAEGLLGAPRWVLAQALGELDDTYDGIASYLLRPGGMRPAANRRAQDRSAQPDNCRSALAAIADGQPFSLSGW